MGGDVVLVVSHQLGHYYQACLVQGERELSVRCSWLRDRMEAWLQAFAEFTGLGVTWVDDRPGAAWSTSLAAATPIDGIAAAKSPVYGIEAIGYWDNRRGLVMELVKGNGRGDGDVLSLGAIWQRAAAERHLEAWRSLTGHGGGLADERYFPEAVIDDRDRRRIFGTARHMGVDPQLIKQAIGARFSVESTNQLTKRQGNLVVYDMIPALAAGTWDVAAGTHLELPAPVMPMPGDPEQEAVNPGPAAPTPLAPDPGDGLADEGPPKLAKRTSKKKKGTT